MFDTPIIFYGQNYYETVAKARESVLGIVSQFDFNELQIEGKNYLIEQITNFLADVDLTPYEGKHKVYLFHHADKMLPVHANALLKTLEEKPEHAIILLVTNNINQTRIMK